MEDVLIFSSFSFIINNILNQKIMTSDFVIFGEHKDIEFIQLREAIL